MSADPSPIDAAIARWRESLPEQLWEQRTWLLWKRRPKPGKPGKFDKIPHYANGRQRCGANGGAEDRAQLVEFGDALVAFRSGCYAGIGVAVLEGGPFWALDLDDCIDAAKNLSPLARRVVDSATYVERSPSGSGVRALFAGKIGVNAKNHRQGVETFNDCGFVTLTGDRLGGEELSPCPPALLAELLLIVRAGRRAQASNLTASVPPENPGLVRTVRLPLRIWGRLAAPYPPGTDRSAAAFSLALQLASNGLTPEQMLELMSAPAVLAPALERRAGDIASAREWLHRYVVLPAYGKAQTR